MGQRHFAGSKWTVEPVDINTLLCRLIGHPVYDLVEERFSIVSNAAEVLVTTSRRTCIVELKDPFVSYQHIQLILQIRNVMRCNLCIFPRIGDMDLD